MSRPMKDSGIAWIGKIPDNWNVARLKDIKSNDRYAIVDGPFGTAISTSDYVDEGVPLVRILNLGNPNVTNDNLVHITQEHAMTVQRSRFGIGDIIFAKTGATIGKCAINDTIEYGILSSSCVKISIDSKFNNRFFYYLFLTNQFNTALRFACVGTTRDTINLSPFSCLPCILPSPSEQSCIAAFLDRRCAEIDRIIEQTQRTIEEYKKLKQSIITEAVTHGVRGRRKMKDSGVEWIGEIPEEWDTVKLKYFVTIRSGITLGKVYPSGTQLFEFPYLRVANVQGGSVKLDDIATIMVTEEESMKYRLQAGELLMTEGGDRDKLGRGTVWHGEIEPCLHQNHVFALRSDAHKLLAEYIEFLSTSFVGRDYFDVTANQSVHLASTNSTTILNFMIPYPVIDEQIEIVAFLNAKCTKIEQMISTKQRLITELEVYKKSVIYEYVTGKRAVPE